MKSTKTLLYAAIAATLLAGGLALASAGEHEDAADYYQQRGPIPFEAFDRNGDGQLSAAEFNDVRAARQAWRAKQGYPMRHAAQAPNFDAIDGNGDGMISPDEHAAFHQQRMQGRMQQRMAPGPRCAGASGR